MVPIDTKRPASLIKFMKHLEREKKRHKASHSLKTIRYILEIRRIVPLAMNFKFFWAWISILFFFLEETNEKKDTKIRTVR